jgi:cytochrome c oxidase subunit III
MTARASAPHLGEQYDDLDQQRESASLGMWIFLGTEIMLFGALFLTYTVYRHAYPQAWAAASRQTNMLIGTTNTAVLLCSSLTMALGVHAAQAGERKRLMLLLFATMALGIVFMALKGYEYYDDFEKHLVPGFNFAMTDAVTHREGMFFVIYFITTGLHALHLTIGIVFVGIMLWKAFRRRFSPDNYTGVELTGLYWHLVDIIWVFLYPLLYLVGRGT